MSRIQATYKGSWENNSVEGVVRKIEPEKYNKPINEKYKSKVYRTILFSVLTQAY